MNLAPYRTVLARPGVRSLLVVSILSRIPVTAAPIALTLHVVLEMHLGFARSGLVLAAAAVGGALGAPALGAVIDRAGLRPVLLATTGAEVIFWAAAAHTSYVVLVPAAFAIGALSLPVFTISRQSLAALVPPGERQAAFSLDSMSVEVSFAIGPALGVVAVTQLGSPTTFALIAVTMFLAGAGLYRLDPPVRGEEGVDPIAAASASGKAAGPAAGGSPVGAPDRTPNPGVRDWLSPEVVAVLLATFGATFTLVGTDAAFTAAMREFDEVRLLGVIIAVWCLASLVGGFAYGLAHRRVDPLVLLALLAGLTVPVALATNGWTLGLLAVPTGLFCAPLLASTAERLTAITPATVRGRVMGTHASALTVGNAVGAPVTGLVIDHRSADAGFVAIGALGLALALLGLLAQGQRRRRTATATAAPEPVGVGVISG
ncbi:MAG: MFS transporter [bacterium]